MLGEETESKKGLFNNNMLLLKFIVYNFILGQLLKKTFQINPNKSKIKIF